MKSKWEDSLQNFFFSIGVFCFVFVALFVSVEMGYRFFVNVQPSLNALEIEDSLHVPRPYVMAVADPETSGINSLGYKGPLPSVPKPSNEYHIAMLGGSTVFGNNPGEEGRLGNALPWHLEQALQKQFGERVKVFNFGNVSSIARQDLVRLYQDVVHLDPELVVYYGGGNDFLQMDSRPGYPHRFLFYEVNPLWVNARDYPLIHMTAYGSLFLRHFFRRYFESYFLNNTRTNFFYHPDLPHNKNSQNSYMYSLIYMNIISNSYGADFISFSQPVKSLYFSDEKQKVVSRNWFLSVENNIKTLAPEVNHISLANFFKNSPESIWRDSIHIVDSANKDLAQQLANQIKKSYSKNIKRLINE